MCDYSEQMRRRCTRKAMVGDELELIALGRWARGFAKHGGKRGWMLTCLRPGTEVVFDKRQVLSQCRSFVECGHGERVLVNDILPREARFASLPNGVRERAVDGFEFSNGLQCGMAAIDTGARLRVLQLPAKRRRARLAEAGNERELERVER